MKKTFYLLLIMILAISGFTACQGEQREEEEDSKDIVVTDMANREVRIPKNAEKFVAIGPGALRLYCYVADPDKIVGIEEIEKNRTEGRPYILANKALTEVPTIGVGGPGNAPDSEKLLEVNPDVIFTMYSTETGAIDELQGTTGIPVVALTYGKEEVFDPGVDKSIELIGEVTGEEKRAEEVIEFFADIKKDLENRTKDIPDEHKPTVYMGGIGYRGAHGIESTTGNFSLFNAIHANNCVDQAGISEYIMLDKEKILEMDPEVIFIDGGGFALVKEDYEKNKDFYNGLQAFKEDKVYMHLPYNYYYTNIDVALADAYYMGSIISPRKFEDVNPHDKFNEITKFLLGEELYDQMTETYFGGYQKVELDK